MAVRAGPPILLLLSLITLCVQSCLEAAAPYPLSSIVRLGSVSGWPTTQEVVGMKQEAGSRLIHFEKDSVESKLYNSFPYSALAALKMEMAGSASFQSAKNCLYRVRARTWAASATAPVDFSIPRHWREPDLAVLALPRGYPHNCWLSARSLLKGSSLKGSSGTLHQQIHALAADDRAYNTR
jgi:hypothetical protein